MSVTGVQLEKCYEIKIFCFVLFCLGMLMGFEKKGGGEGGLGGVVVLVESGKR